MSVGAIPAPPDEPAARRRVAVADRLVVSNDRPELTTLRLDAIAAAPRGSTIVDVRSVLSPDDVREAGPTAVGVGRR
jgi:hypothetical protein